jgi:hypothetical protein
VHLECSTLLFDKFGGLAGIPFNRPHAANAINLDLAREFSDAIRICAEDPAIRAYRALPTLFRSIGHAGSLSNRNAAPADRVSNTHFHSAAITQPERYGS